MTHRLLLACFLWRSHLLTGKEGVDHPAWTFLIDRPPPIASIEPSRDRRV